MAETSASQGIDAQQPHAGLPTLGWAVRRAVMGLILVVAAATGGAVLLHASIEPDAVAQTPPKGSTLQSVPAAKTPDTTSTAIASH